MEPQIVAILNALKGPPASILLALLSSARPLGTNDLVYLTGWCESSVIAGLQKLELLGWVERQARYNGWALVRAVRVSVIPKIFAVTELALSSGEEPPGNCEILSSPPSGEDEGAQDLDGNCNIQGSLIYEQTHPDHPLTGNREIYSSNRMPDNARNSGQQSSRASQGSQPEGESQEEDLNLNTLDSSSSDSDSRLPPEIDSPGHPDPLLSSANVPRILAATRQLFGERVMGNPARYPDPVRLLAAIAEAYQNRCALRKPARVVFKNLRNETNISPEYLEDPLSFLPESFLQEAGLPRPRSPAKSAYSRYLAGLPDYDVDEEEQVQSPLALSDLDPSLSLLVADPPSRPAAEAWTLAISTLESQLDPDLFSKYLAGATFVRYDFPSNTFTVAVTDPYTRDWLQERLGKLIGLLLNGICGRPAAIHFVTDDQVVEEG